MSCSPLRSTSSFIVVGFVVGESLADLPSRTAGKCSLNDLFNGGRTVAKKKKAAKKKAAKKSAKKKTPSKKAAKKAAKKKGKK